MMTNNEPHSTDSDPAYEERLRNRLETLREELDAGNVIFASHLREQILESFAKIRTGPDGKIDLSTVDGRIRVVALSVEHYAAVKEAKSISLDHVQTEYFAMLEDLLGDVANHCKKHDIQPYQFATYSKTNTDIIKQISTNADSISEIISNFWDNYGFVVKVHLEEMENVRGVFGGDVFPIGSNNIGCQAGVYLDTIVLPDPLLRLYTRLRSTIPDHELTYQVIKHGLTALSYKPLAFTDTSAPIIVIAPGSSEAETSIGFKEFVREDTLLHLNSAIGSDFQSLDELLEYVSTIEDPNDLEKKSLRPERLLSGASDDPDLLSRMQAMEKFAGSRTSINSLLTGLTEYIVADAYGRMGQANAVLIASQQYGGMPLLDAPVSWRHLCWKYEYDATRSQSPDTRRVDMTVVNALVQSSDITGELLAGITPEGLVELRNSGLMEDVRSIIRDGLSDIYAQNEVGDEATAAKVVRNFTEAIKAAEDSLSKWRSKRRTLFLRDIPELTAASSLVIAGTVGGNYALTLVAAAATMIGFPTIKDVWKQGKELVDQGEQLRKTPFGLLLWNRSG